MPLGTEYQDTPQSSSIKKPKTTEQKKKGAYSPDWVCRPDFIEYEGMRPHLRQQPAPPEPDPNSEDDWEFDYEPWTKEDEIPGDESDLIVPPGWETDPRHRRPDP